MSDLPKEETNQRSLCLVKKPDERLRPTVDPELKALLDDLKRRYQVMHQRLEDDGDTPGAA